MAGEGRDDREKRAPIQDEELFEEGLRAGYDHDPDVEQRVNYLRKTLVVQRRQDEIRTTLQNKAQPHESLHDFAKLFEEGLKAGYDRDPVIDQRVNALRKSLVVQRVMRERKNPRSITNEQVQP